MSRIPPAKQADLDAETQAILAAGDEIMGFKSNDALVMAHNPEMLKAMLGLVRAVYQEGSVSLELKKLVAVMTSSAAGCLYCKTHTLYGALNEGVDPAKLAAIWGYATDPLFTESERAALDVARLAAFTPNENTDVSFAALRPHYTEQQIVEIVGVIALFGFLNRWNSTLATDIEIVPQAAVAEQGLTP